MSRKTPKTALVAFKVEEELAEFLNKLPNKSAFIRKAIAAHIRLEQKRGMVRPGIDADAAAGWITWMAERGMNQLVPPADAATRRRLATSMATIVWHGVYHGAKQE